MQNQLLCNQSLYQITHIMVSLKIIAEQVRWYMCVYNVLIFPKCSLSENSPLRMDS